MGDWILPDVKKEIEERRAARKLREEHKQMENYLVLPPNYVLIDGAMWKDELSTAKLHNENCRSLYRGAMGEQLDSVAPYLFDIQDNGDFIKWIRQKDPIEYRVTWLHSTSTIDELRKHLRRFLRMKTEKGAFLYFRFYDPYVTDCTIPSFTMEQAVEFFKQINYLRVEDYRTDECNTFYILESADNLQIKREVLCGQ